MGGESGVWLDVTPGILAHQHDGVSKEHNTHFLGKKKIKKEGERK